MPLEMNLQATPDLDLELEPMDTLSAEGMSDQVFQRGLQGNPIWLTAPIRFASSIQYNTKNFRNYSKSRTPNEGDIILDTEGFLWTVSHTMIGLEPLPVFVMYEARIINPPTSVYNPRNTTDPVNAVAVKEAIDGALDGISEVLMQLVGE